MQIKLRMLGLLMLPLLAVSSCSSSPDLAATNQATNQDEQLRQEAISHIDKPAAIDFANTIAQDIIEDNRGDIDSKIASFEGIDKDMVNAAIDYITTFGGKPIDVTYNKARVGIRDKEDERFYYCQIFYDVKTTKYDVGKYQLVISLVQSNDQFYLDGLEYVIPSN